MQHLIIGGSGFLGSELTKALLARNQNVVIVDCIAPNLRNSNKMRYIELDITNAESLFNVPLETGDIVYHLAARQYHLQVPSRRNRSNFFDSVNVDGTRNVLHWMDLQHCRKLIYFSTDMVYGYPRQLPVPPTHTQEPIGEYGNSKRASEAICLQYRKKGFNITIFRPRLIVGPGRLGVLQKLFGLIAKGWPVPLIGNGKNQYQMISVFDCVSAILCAVEKGLPNQEFNLGSSDPPQVDVLLHKLIDRAGSKSILLRMPGTLIKDVLDHLDRVGMTVLYPEQFSIADRDYLVDTESTQKTLCWKPQYSDEDMMYSAFSEYLIMKNNEK